MYNIVGRTSAAVLLVALAAAACGDVPSDYTPTAATAPSSDIFLGTLQRAADRWQVADVINITDRDGYDNQPFFTPDGTALLYTSARDTSQTDIYQYDVATGTVTQVTHTPMASEYSPTVMPSGTEFSTIHEDAARQQLWHFGLDGSDRGGLLDALSPVGYHAWGDENTVAAFVLGDSIRPSTLQLADVSSGETWIVAENIGRSLHRVPGLRAISFVHKVSSDEWLIKAVDLDTRSVTTITPTLPGREDYAWSPDGSIVMGDDSKLYRWAEGREWEVVADLSAFGVRGITRVAVSARGDRIALVGKRRE
ncbi:MAG: PD40 domain-containing protein [Gemmatimonadota bacterium]|nr:MAG: PD40 domain-containing protein [Gemmatimonadota bacterium]